MNNYVQNFMKRYNYPQEAVQVLTEVCNRLEAEKSYGERMQDILARHYQDPTELLPYLEETTAIGEEMGIPSYTMHFVFIIMASEKLLEKYHEAGLEEEIFWDTFADTRYKLMECIENKNTVGTMSDNWYRDFFKLRLFGLGRFQYQFAQYDATDEFTMSSGHVIHRGDPLLSIHIPSSGVPLTDDVRMDSYRKAFRFITKHYKDIFGEGPLLYRCNSWLMYPRHTEFLPKKSNILKFMSDFEVVGEKDTEFTNSWRLFGHYSVLPLSEWPKNNSLRKAYVEWLEQGNPTGIGYTVMLFDGDKIVR